MRMRRAWERQAGDWIHLVRGGLDRWWDFTRPAFLGIVPQPGRLTLDLGCGEGRVGRMLQEAGHRLIGLDATFALAQAAACSHVQPLSVLVADAAHVPLHDGAADLVVAFFSLQDIDDVSGAAHEAARVLEPGGRFCFAIPHPVAEAGRFQEDGSFLLDRSYLGVWRYPDPVERNDGEVAFHSEHRPIQAYSGVLEDAGFVIEIVREPAPDAPIAAAIQDAEQWRRVPKVLMIRARLD